MSFILNALRKSEQERQALQAENVTDRILLPQPPQSSSKTTKLLVFLFIANVLVITGIVWLVRDNLMSAPDTTASAISPSLPVQDVKLESKAIAQSTQPKKLAQKAESEITSIAKLVDKEKQEPAPLPVKPAITKKPVVDAADQPVFADDLDPLIEAIPARAAAAKLQADETETIAVINNIPFLNDLPFEFRQTIPKFTINVFVYSQDPEERFIMIDMVKYKPGQQIKDTMLLKEILSDGFVVDYQNQVFKIKRP